MQRIYFLIPDAAAGRAIATDLRLAHIESRHVHVLAREGTPLGNLREATIAQRSDLIPALESGAAAGSVTGALLGLVALAFPTGLVLDGDAVLAMALFGAGFGAWVSSMIGVRLPNRRLQQYERAVACGRLLMMIDVPAARVGEIESVVRTQHPEVELRGVEPVVPALP